MLEFGYKDQWEQFEKKHGTFVEKFPHLKEAMNIALGLHAPLPEITDTVVLFLSLRCLEDFMEILLLCGNGYGLGAMTLLRGMYERAVIACYLNVEPSETENFYDYYWVSQHKLQNAVLSAYDPSVLPSEKVYETERTFQEVKGKFEVTDCATCRTTRLNHTWSKLDFVSMAKKTGNLGKLIVPAYLLPTQVAHGTVRSMLTHLQEPAPGKFMFISGISQDTEIHTTLITAHNICLYVLDMLEQRFHISSLENPLEECMRDFIEIWKGEENTSSAEVSDSHL